MTAKVGETVRVYFGVGGPNKVSSFHVIGEIFDKVYSEGSVPTVKRDVQATLVEPAGKREKLANSRWREARPGAELELAQEPDRPALS